MENNEDLKETLVSQVEGDQEQQGIAEDQVQEDAMDFSEQEEQEEQDEKEKEEEEEEEEKKEM